MRRTKASDLKTGLHILRARISITVCMWCLAAIVLTHLGFWAVSFYRTWGFISGRTVVASENGVLVWEVLHPRYTGGDGFTLFNHEPTALERPWLIEWDWSGDPSGWLVVPWWILAFFWLLLYIAAFIAARYDRRLNVCRCGYDLTGNVSGRCPECGRPVASRAVVCEEPAD